MNHNNLLQKAIKTQKDILTQILGYSEELEIEYLKIITKGQETFETFEQLKTLLEIYGGFIENFEFLSELSDIYELLKQEKKKNIIEKELCCEIDDNEPKSIRTKTEEEEMLERKNKVKRIESAINDCGNFIGEYQVFKILEGYRQDADQFVDDYLNGKFEDIWKKTNIYLAPKVIKGNSDSIECPICFEDFPISKIVSLGCHQCCTTCLEKHVESQIGTENICCFHPKCNTIIVDKDIETFCSKNVLENFLQNNQRSISKMKYCPNPKCSRVFGLNVQGNVICLCCSTSQCMTCKNSCHFPMTCKQAEYLETLMSKGVVKSVKNVFIKQCPKCNVSIQKDQGCSHMTCSRCKHQFCWICLENFNSHTKCKTIVKESQITFEGKNFSGEHSNTLERISFLDAFYNTNLFNKNLLDQDKLELKRLIDLLKNIIAYSNLFNQNYQVDIMCELIIGSLLKESKYVTYGELIEKLYLSLDNYKFNTLDDFKKNLITLFQKLPESSIPNLLKNAYESWKIDENFMKNESENHLHYLMDFVSKEGLFRCINISKN